MEPTPDQMRRELAKPRHTKASEALGKHEGKTLMVTQADRTKVGGGYLGGPGFSSLQHTDPAYEGKAWGVMTPGMASTILGANKRVPEGQAVWSTLIGTPEQHTSNQMVFDKLVKDFNKNAKLGALTPELHAKINERLSAVADKQGKPFFGPGADIRDPELIKAANTFAKRKIIADLIGGHGVGGKKGQIGKYDELLHSTTEPDLLGVPTHAIGPRLFGLSGETSNRPDLHPAFPQMLHGEDFGQRFHPAPKELMLRDYMKKFIEEKQRKPGYMDLTLGYSPTQHLSEDFLTHLQKHGYAEGGAVEGGEVKADEPSHDEMLAHIMLHGMSSLKDVGANEAPNMPIKTYVPQGPGPGFPVGGVDFQPEVKGQQMLPGQPNAPMGTTPPQLGQPAGQMPPSGQPPAPALGGPQSNILQMTPQGQAMAAMKASPPMAKMAEGGIVDAGMLNPSSPPNVGNSSSLGGLSSTPSGASSMPYIPAPQPSSPIAAPMAQPMEQPMPMPYAKGGSIQAMKRVLANKKAAGGPVHMAGGSVDPQYPSLQEMIQHLQQAGRTSIVPAPNRWFADPVKHPHQQKMIERVLAQTGQGREGFPSGSYINPQTGEPMDFDIMHDLGVAIDPKTGRPMMSGIKSDLTEVDPKYGSITKSNLVRKGLFKHEGGDELLKNLAFLATIEKSGKGHHYGLSTQYASPAELVNTMTGQNPTLRPHSRGDIFGMGDEVGRISIQGKHHPVYEKLLVAPTGSDVPGRKLHKAAGGTIKDYIRVTERPL